MANNGRSGAASSNMEAILGTVIRLCVPLGVLMDSLKKPCSAKFTVVSCSESESSFTLGAVGLVLPQFTHSCAKRLMVKRLMMKRKSGFFILIYFVQNYTF